MNYPEKFIDIMHSLPGGTTALDTMNDTESPVAIRLNPIKPITDSLPSSLRRVPWEPLGIHLNNRPRFTFHTGIYSGQFYVQDPSSMIVGEALRRIIRQDERPLYYLDACASPGGKTTAALSVLPPKSFVLANEFARDRFGALVDNLQRWGTSNYAISNIDARCFDKLGEVFDIVSADVPCSGEGMMRKNPTALTQWSPALVADCARLQREIVKSLCSVLKPGGYLIYSTCTFNTTENENNCRWIRDELGLQTVDLKLDEFNGVLPSVSADLPAARFMPGLVEGEGQFISVFRKPGHTGSDNQVSNCSHLPKSRPCSRKNSQQRCSEWLVGDFQMIENADGEIFAVESTHASFVNYLRQKINLPIPGVHIASPKGRDLMPAHCLGTATARKFGAFPEAEVDYATAMSFLRGEAIVLESSVPNGYVLITHRGNPLGWVKNIGNRANNLMPAARRIRSSFVPDCEPTLTP